MSDDAEYWALRESDENAIGVSELKILSMITEKVD